ncbi:MAG: DNA mismatch repair protein MutS [Hyphomicrobiales bacterium]
MNDVSEPSAAGRVDDATPLMAQYLEIKAAHPGSLLFYRMGDFYELFFEDAGIAADALGIALTKRGKHRGEDIPMCGVPVHSADQYLARLIRAGHRVAICEQVEDPQEARKRGAKSVVKRSVIRLVTPGTLTEESLLDAKSHSYLAALGRVRSEAPALAWADISSGEFAAKSIEPGSLAADLAALGAREIIVSDALAAEPDVKAALDGAGASITPLPGSRFDSAAGERRLAEHFGVKTLDGFGSFTRSEISCLGGVLDYILLTQAGRVPALQPPKRETGSRVMIIDAATRSNLELTRTLAGDASGSLLDSIDRTVTATGARLLGRRLAQPLTDREALNRRLESVSVFHGDHEIRDKLRSALRHVPDIERALSRISLARGGPRDLASIRDGLAVAAEVARSCSHSPALGEYPAELGAALDAISAAPRDLVVELDQVLGAELPADARDGGFVRAGYSAELDRERGLRDETRRVIAALQARYSEETGIKSLKVRHNNVLGYFIEAGSQHAPSLMAAPLNTVFFHRQTVANAVRFTTEELSGFEQRIAAAAGNALRLEIGIFDACCERVKSEARGISGVAGALAVLDVAAALAELAASAGYVRPRLVEEPVLHIKRGRHPVVETKVETGRFIANDCCLADTGKRLLILTGPNMAGKSTFLRQNALIVILAHIGSFVPAAEAEIGIVDRLFSRVGAADDLARGRSTFMVEMVETAAILNQASPRSFVILDEIGRGTATFDGLSIAWAAIEHLHDTNGCRALFATHYHELTALAARLPHVANATVKVREWRGEVIFLHEVAAGIADRSYGIQVAKLAGLPKSVIARSAEVLARLEKTDRGEKGLVLLDDLPLFATPPMRPSSEEGRSPILERLAATRPDELTPRAALELIYELKAMVKDEG